MTQRGRRHHAGALGTRQCLAKNLYGGNGYDEDRAAAEKKWAVTGSWATRQRRPRASCRSRRCNAAALPGAAAQAEKRRGRRQ
jgi:hypothetical protein